MAATATSPAAGTTIPTLGAEIELPGGRVIRIHQDCKDARDRFTAFLRRRALAVLDEMRSSKDITQAEWEYRRKEAFADFQSLKYDYGTLAFRDAAGTDAGVKQQLYIRAALNFGGKGNEEPADLANAIAAWVDSVGWEEANRVMALADGHAPKELTPADGPLSAGI